MASIGATCCAPLPPGKKRRRPKGQRREARPGGYAGLIGLLFPAASADPGGRDQGLVRRTCATRHLEVRHWITSFPLLHLEAVMPSRAAPVKAFWMSKPSRCALRPQNAPGAHGKPRRLLSADPTSCLLMKRVPSAPLLAGNGVRGLLTLTRYKGAMCDGGNPCARQSESAPAGRAGRGNVPGSGDGGSGKGRRAPTSRRGARRRRLRRSARPCGRRPGELEVHSCCP
jgi:hypothetical protein